MRRGGVDVYRRIEAESRSPLELVVMLYDGALASVSAARTAAANGDVPGRGAAVSRALAIVGMLQEHLNLTDGGAIAAELDRLYHYVTARLLDVTVRNDVQALGEVQRLLTQLRDAWQQIATSPPAPQTVAAQP
jgi:flagellar protein FliS